MRFLSRVVWSEGMHLSPEHFQTQSRYFEDSLWYLIASIRNHPWGLLSLTLDNDAIRNGLAVVLHASGIFPDGLLFEFPDSDSAPAPLALKSVFSPSDSEITLHLAVPARISQGLEATSDRSLARYGTFDRTLRDETISDDEFPVTLGRKNLFLLASADVQPGHISFPVARIQRDGKGGFVADPAFLPPILRIGVIEDLLLRTKRIADSIEEMIAVTRRGKKAVGQFETGTSALDVANYWFLHALCSALPAIRQQIANRNGHPEQLYATLAELSGALCTFILTSDPSTLPVYDHLDLNRVFRELEDHIRHHLNIIIPSNCVTLEFEPAAAPYLHVAPILDERCLRRSRWIFGIRSEIAESALMRLTPNQVKICSGEWIGKLVQKALPGMELTHLPVPPSAMRSEADMIYFSIGTTGPCWQHILSTKQVGVYLPGEFGNAVFEVTVIIEANQ